MPGADGQAAATARAAAQRDGSSAGRSSKRIRRAAAAIAAVGLQLAVAGDAVALTAIERGAVAPAAATAAPSTLADRIEAQLATAATPLTAAALRKLCKVRNATLTAALTKLVAASRVRKDTSGYVISH